ncbi:MAG: TerC family protein [Pirellulales bacterium]
MLEVTTIHWVAFCSLVAILLILDLLIFHRHAHEPSLRESAGWTVFWSSLALCFNGLIWWWGGPGPGIDFFTGYLVEWSLSMDNVFVFIVIFAYFRVPLKYQYRVLFWGILGAIAMRLTFILIAGELLERFDWVLYLFGAFLLYTGVKLAFAHGSESSPENNIVIRTARRVLPVSATAHGDKFFVREGGRLMVTPLFLVLLAVESTDVVFAVDSVPAIFGITDDPFIVFTSNVFAIMGLRALYFLLAGVVDMFRYLSYGLAAVLVFIGAKMLLHDFIHLPNWASLAVIASLLSISIIASLIAARRNPTPPHPDAVQPLPAEPEPEPRGK